MKALASATGVPKSAILHYVSQGLLPEPVRTGPNMAYYDPACIERIEFIKTMQETYAFPLSKIRMLLTHRERGMDVTPLIDLSAAIFGNADSPPLTETELCASTGLKRGQLRELVKTGLLLPLEKGTFNQQDLAACEVYAKCLALGAEAQDLAFYAEAAKMIVDREMGLRSKLTVHLPEVEDAEISRRMVLGARVIRTYVIERVFQQRAALAEELKDARLVSGGSHPPQGKQ
ncbi:MAG: MerR family transcriptional regulator [Desulfuromonadales bacterium]|nr:MerR family transcriptional regulator [Desulfuromonadales bacterium]